MAPKEVTLHIDTPLRVYMKLIGIYHADGGFWGELRYVIGKVIGVNHCALCDLTHGWSPREKSEFQWCKAQLSIPLETLHLNEQDEKLAKFTLGQTPCIVLDQDGSLSLAMSARELEECAGDMGRLLDLLKRAVQQEP
jgi:hypothetical protein